MATSGPGHTLAGDHVKIKDLHGKEYALPFDAQAFSHLTIGEVRIICQGRVLTDASRLLACVAGTPGRPRAPPQPVQPATALANDVLASMGFRPDPSHGPFIDATEQGAWHTNLTYSESAGWQWGSQHPPDTHPPHSATGDTYTTMDGCLRRLEAMNRHTYGGGAEGGGGGANVQYVHRLPVLIGPQLQQHTQDTASALSLPNPPWLHPPYENRRRRWSSPRPGTHPADIQEGTSMDGSESTHVQDRLANQIAQFAETTATYEPVLDLVATLLTSRQDGQAPQPIRSSHQRVSANGLLQDTVRYLRLVEAQAACLADALAAVHVDPQGKVAHSSTLPEPSTIPTGRLPLFTPHIAHSHTSFTAIDGAHFERAHEDAHAAAHTAAMEAARQSLRGISRQSTSRSAVVGLRFRQHVVSSANQNGGLDGGNVIASTGAGFGGFGALGGGGGRNGTEEGGRRGVEGDIVMSMETTSREHWTAGAQQAQPPSPAISVTATPSTANLQPLSMHPDPFNFQAQTSTPPPVETADITDRPHPRLFSTLGMSPQTTSTLPTSRNPPPQNSSGPQISTNPFQFTPATTWGQDFSVSFASNPPPAFQPTVPSSHHADLSTNQMPASTATVNQMPLYFVDSSDELPPRLAESDSSSGEDEISLPATNERPQFSDGDGPPSLSGGDSDEESHPSPPSANQRTPSTQEAHENSSAEITRAPDSPDDNETPPVRTPAPRLFLGGALNFRPSITDIIMQTFGRRSSGQGDGGTQN